MSKIKRSNVTVFLEVFNEELRIESCLKSFAWADEVIVFDKQSTDRTREIAAKYATEIVLVPYCEASENIVINLSRQTSTDWCLFPTASSLMHPRLADEIIKLTTDSNFKFDVIGMPYGMHAFGIRSLNSPWAGVWKFTLIRKSVMNVSNKLHHEIGFSSKKIYKMPLLARNEVLYHCTHKDVADFLGRTIRYTKYEAEHEKVKERNLALKTAFIDILKSAFTVLIRRRSFLLGWDGIALSLAYICNFVLKFLFIWDSHRENGNKIYPELRKNIDALWDARKLGESKRVE